MNNYTSIEWGDPGMSKLDIKKAIIKTKKKLAGELEEHLKYKEAIDIWEELGEHGEAKRVRKKIRDDGRVKVDQTVVHGNYVDDRDTTYIDDRDTIVKDYKEKNKSRLNFKKA